MLLYYALAFFIIAVVAGIFGFTKIAAGAIVIARVFFGIFLVLFLGFLVAGLLGLHHAAS